MVSFPPVSPPRPCTLPSPHPYAPHAQPISFFSILSPAQYWVSSTNHLAPHYAIPTLNLNFLKLISILQCDLYIQVHCHFFLPHFTPDSALVIDIISCWLAHSSSIPFPVSVQNFSEDRGSRYMQKIRISDS